uniref:Uncharacterized protein n=1 Tax=Daucus carota subsp. sativus TaxID=79200 RepID=A0A166GNS5_DAUCS
MQQSQPKAKNQNLEILKLGFLKLVIFKEQRYNLYTALEGVSNYLTKILIWTAKRGFKVVLRQVSR